MAQASRFTWQTRYLLEALVGVGILTTATLVPALVANTYWTRVWVLVAIYAIAAVGLNILKESGQFSFGQGAIFGASAYAAAMAVQHGMNIITAAFIGVLAAVAFGVLLALPGFRVQGFYLGFVTLCGAMVFPDLLYAFDRWTNAVAGISAPVPGLQKPIVGALTPLVIVVLLAFMAAVATHTIIRSTRWCRQMRLTAHSPEAAMAMGIRPGKIRVSAFIVASVLAGVAGALYVPFSGYVGPGAFPLTLSIMLYFAVVVGGEGTVLGPVIGVILLYIIPEVLLTGLLDYRLIVYGALTFGLMALLPDGVVPAAEKLLGRLRRGGRTEKGHAVHTVLTEVGASANARPTPALDAPQRPVLTIEGVQKSFGAVRALRGVDLVVREGTVHGLIGPNGCGKSTLLNVVSGFVTPDQGQVILQDRDASAMSAVAVARRGVGRTFQTPRLVDDLSAWENLTISTDFGRSAELSTLLLSHARELHAGTVGSLPHAHRRIVETLRACAGANQLLLLDEPAGGLSVAERLTFVALIRRLVAETGVAVLLVEHDLSLVWDVADDVTLMAEGSVVATGTTEEVRNHDSLKLLVGG